MTGEIFQTLYENGGHHECNTANKKQKEINGISQLLQGY